jgi:hypothetical protein
MRERVMTIRARRALAAGLTIALVSAAGALAAGPLRGKTYQGGAPSYGVSSEGHHRVRTHATGNVILRVGSSGRSVTVRFSPSSFPVLYCNTQQRIRVQTGKSASISSSGSFKAAVGERFAAGPGPPGIVQIITGRFSGGFVSGKIATHAADCSGVSSFSARAR